MRSPSEPGRAFRSIDGGATPNRQAQQRKKRIEPVEELALLHAALYDQRLTRADQSVFSAVLQHADENLWCCPGRRRLTRITKLSLPTVKRAIKRLGWHSREELDADGKCKGGNDCKDGCQRFGYFITRRGGPVDGRLVPNEYQVQRTPLNPAPIGTSGDPIQTASNGLKDEPKQGGGLGSCANPRMGSPPIRNGFTADPKQGSPVSPEYALEVTQEKELPRVDSESIKERIRQVLKTGGQRSIERERRMYPDEFAQVVAAMGLTLDALHPKTNLSGSNVSPALPPDHPEETLVV